MTKHLIQEDIMDKLQILGDAAKYDVACTSSGVSRQGNGQNTGNTYAGGICHTFTSDGRCISLLKILMSNDCIYDCKYCINRCSNDTRRVSFTPEEICTLTMEFYRRNYIEGLFLSSGIIVSPDNTMQLLYQTLYMLRFKYNFNGYIHIKGIPGASPDIIESIGYLCDRMSVNLELPTSDALKSIAPNKVRANILKPMRFIQNGIKESRHFHGINSTKSKIYIDEKSYYEQMSEIEYSQQKLTDTLHHNVSSGIKQSNQLADSCWKFNSLQKRTSQGLSNPDRYFVPAGQSTQMIIGATQESDYEIMSVTEALYNKFDMKRVFYSAFINVNNDSNLPTKDTSMLLLREHRLYQADFLLRFYGFKMAELLSENNPNFNELVDPKCNWALKHLEFFPIEINKADYYSLLRVPGIGNKSARRILAARKHAILDFNDIKKMGVVLKRAIYFITCNGKMMYKIKMNEDYILRQLLYGDKPTQMMLSNKDDTIENYEQLSIFDFVS